VIEPRESSIRIIIDPLRSGLRPETRSRSAPARAWLLLRSTPFLERRSSSPLRAAPRVDRAGYVVIAPPGFVVDLGKRWGAALWITTTHTFFAIERRHR